MGRVDGKVAFITGMARGQGRSHAIRLAQEGADIIGIDICQRIRNVPYAAPTEADLGETADAVRAVGRRVAVAPLDVRDMESMAKFVDVSVEEMGRLDIVVANAAICIPEAWDHITPEVWADTIDVNLTGVWNTVRACAPNLVKRRAGSIILVSSAAGVKAKPFLSPYVASKFAVTGLAQALAQELGEHNIRVNSLHPGPVHTPMGGIQAIHDLIAAHPNLGKAFTHILPVGQMDPTHISDAVLFLASDESRYMTGHSLAVDTGSF